VSNFAIKATELLVIYFPLVRVLGIVAVVVAATIYLFRVRFSRHKWLTVCARIIGVAFGLCLILGFIFTLFVLVFGGGISRPRVSVSPDSQHIAFHYYQPGFLGRDSTWVTVGKKWSLETRTVYEYDGPSDWTDTQVIWLSYDRLLVRYFLEHEGRYQQCDTDAGVIRVQCVPVER
jgi:hypothetical protein